MASIYQDNDYDWWERTVGDTSPTEVARWAAAEGQTVEAWCRGYADGYPFGDRPDWHPEDVAARMVRIVRRALADEEGGYSPIILQALSDWKSGRAYIDGRGNYHVKKEWAYGLTSSGPIASWNKEAKRLFPSAHELHAAANGKG